jgi:dienelactone hydrolase
VVSPPGTADPASLPVCLALHGRGGSAQGLLDLGLPQFLAAATARGVRPFHLVAVDGGEATYWHRRSPGDDPMAMLLDEVPGWLRARGLAAPSGVLGISMGGSGALQYARARSGGLAAVALLSPALFASWPDARTVDGYQDEADWRAHEPLLHLDQPLTRRLAVWCGTEDPFCPAARRLADRAAETHFPRGAHTDGFWRRVRHPLPVRAGRPCCPPPPGHAAFRVPRAGRTLDGCSPVRGPRSDQWSIPMGYCGGGAVRTAAVGAS